MKIDKKEKDNLTIIMFISAGIGAVLGLLAYTQNWLG